MKKLLTTIAAAVLTLLITTSPGVAADAPPRAKFEFVQETPNRDAGEIEKRKLLVDGELVSITVKYDDGRIKLTEFRDGKMVGEVEQLKGGGLKNSRFKNGKPFEILIIQNGRFEHTEYRPDGKLWFKSVTVKDGTKTSEYHSKDGALRLKRVQQKGGAMDVTVLDAAGKQLYKQHWQAGALESVEEQTSSGARKLVFKDGKLLRADYLRADGSVARSEDADKLSEPFDAKRAEELDSKDDPTVPSPRR